MGINCCSGVD
jgi:hypothetical protein